jgi:molecular chaperone DnaK
MLHAGGESAEIVLHREKPKSDDALDGMLILDDEDEKFYFEERSLDKLTLCKTVLYNTLEKAGLTWNDLDEIVLAGGASRMPMIPEMLENLSRRTIKRNLPGFSPDTAIAQGAALYGRNRSRVIDVSAKSIGIELKTSTGAVIEHLLKKNSPLPISISQTFPAEPNAVLKVYEGESRNPEECTLRGRLELGNPSGEVTVGLSIDFNGVIHASVEANSMKAELKIKSEEGEIDSTELKSKIDKVEIRL